MCTKICMCSNHNMFSIPKPLHHIFPIPFHVKIKQIWTCHGKKHATYQFRVKNEDNPERINANWRFRDWVWVVNKSNIKNCGMMCMGAVFWSVGAHQAKTNKISVRWTICFFVTVKKSQAFGRSELWLKILKKIFVIYHNPVIVHDPKTHAQRTRHTM